MSTSLFLVSVKLLLTLVLVAQVSAPPSVQVPSQIRPILDESVCDKVIAEFREEVEHNAVAFIRRENGQDVVDIDRERYTKRILAVIAKNFWIQEIINGNHPAQGWETSWITGERNNIKLKDLIRTFYDAFVDFELIPPLDIDSSLNDIVMMSHDSSVILGSCIYEKSRQNIDRENIVNFFYGEKFKKKERKNELANYIVPFARNIWAYDGAIDYITRQYQEHCLSPDGIVQHNKLHYLKLWGSSVRRISEQDSHDYDMPLWIEFMSTACPLPEKEIRQLDPKDIPLDLVDFEQEVAVPAPVKKMWPYLPIIKSSSTNSEMISKLVESFCDYKKYERYRKYHDNDLWTGYQKKLIVQQTIIRVMLKDPLITKISETVGEDNKLEQFPTDTQVEAQSNSDKESLNSFENKDLPTTRKCFGSAMWKWTPMVCLAITGTIVYVGALAGLSYGTYLAASWLFGGSPDPTTPFPNITLLPPPPTGIPLPIEPVWLIVGVMIIVAIVLVGTVLCLVCLAKRKRNDGDKDKTSKTAKSKTKKKKDSRVSTVTKSAIKRSPVSSTPTCLLIGTAKDTTSGTPTSPRSASSSLGHQRSSPYTTSAFTTSAIKEAQGHRPVLSPKSPVAKPTFSFSTPRKALSKSPLFIGSSILWSSTPGPDIVNSSAFSQLSSPSSAFPGSNAQSPKVALPTKANSPPTNVKSPPGKAQTGKGNTTTTKPGDTKGAKKRDPKK